MSNVNVQLQDENGNNTFPYTYTNNVFDKNGQPINDRLLYGTREAITILPTVTSPASQNMITEQYDTTKTYPTYSKYCIYDNQLYKYSGASGTTTTGTFDNTKWTATNVINSIDWNTLNNKPSNIAYAGPALATENVPAIDAYLHKSDVVDNFTDGGTDVPLSAECGKLLNSTLTQYADIDTPILSTDTSTYKDFVTNIPNGCIIISATFIYNDDFFYYCNSVGIPAVTIKDDGNKLTIKSSKSIALKDTTNRALKVRIAYKNIS